MISINVTSVDQDTAQHAYPSSFVIVANVADVWSAYHITLVLDAGMCPIVQNAHMRITSSGVKSAKTNIVTIVVTRHTKRESSHAQAVEGCCYLVLHEKMKLTPERNSLYVRDSMKLKAD